jgi:hypothetical protein
VDNDLECKVDKCAQGTSISSVKGKRRGVKGESDLNYEDLSGK